MNQLIKQGTEVLLKVCFLFAIWGSVQAQQLPPVINVQVEGDLLTWDAVEGATGYNIYVGLQYLTTVRGERQYPLTETGNYAVTAFNDAGIFSPRVGSNTVFFSGEVDNRDRLVDVGDGIAYITQRCFDVGAGESCIAVCPGVISDTVGVSNVGSATGGSCSSADTINVNSLISSKEYACTVSSFTARVETKVACLLK